MCGGLRHHALNLPFTKPNQQRAGWGSHTTMDRVPQRLHSSSKAPLWQDGPFHPALHTETRWPHAAPPASLLLPLVLLKGQEQLQVSTSEPSCLPLWRRPATHALSHRPAPRVPCGGIPRCPWSVSCHTSGQSSPTASAGQASLTIRVSGQTSLVPV